MYYDGTYVYSYESEQRIRTLAESVDDKLFFAGDAYTGGSDYSSVHTAEQSAKNAVDELAG